MDHEETLRSVSQFWSEQAHAFDQEPDHGLNDPVTRKAWRERLLGWLPSPPALVADLGCGTGSIAVLLAEEGYEVTGVDLSAAMVDVARQKADEAGVGCRFHLGNASDPNLRNGTFDAVLSRHLLWTLPDPHWAIGRWIRLLAPEGRLVLIEGRWATASPTEPDPRFPWHGGVTASELTKVLEGMSLQVEVHHLSHERQLWGKNVNDERFAVIARSSQ